jgi:hypothetical protein
VKSRIDREICVRREQRTEMSVTKDNSARTTYQPPHQVHADSNGRDGYRVGAAAALTTLCRSDKGKHIKESKVNECLIRQVHADSNARDGYRVGDGIVSTTLCRSENE